MMNCVVLRDKRGIALTGVIVLLFILSLMGTSMYAYSMTSLRSVRYLSDRRKAEYLAEAGVEAASYAYQLAVNETSEPAAVAFVTKSKSQDITTNDVYLIFDNTKSGSDGYIFVSESQLDNYTNKEIIGWYSVTISNERKKVKTKISDGTTDDEGNVNTKTITMYDDRKVFTAVGHTYGSEATYTKTGYISDTSQALGEYYGDDGIIDTTNETYKDNYIELAELTYETNGKITTQHFGSYPFNISSKEITVMLGYSTGNLILSAPASTDTLTLKESADNVVVFAAMNNLFVEAGIDATPSEGYFNGVVLLGNEVIINGDIELYVYCVTRTVNSGILANFKNLFGSLSALISSSYRLGTVIVGTPSTASATVVDPYTESPYDFGTCGRIYFGGDVYVNIQMPNVGTTRYKAFSAGDAYYYNDDDPTTKTASTSEDSSAVISNYGIDLLKYFLEYSIATNAYSSTILSRFEDILELYYEYSGVDSSYITTDTNGNITKDSMRIIDRDKYKDTYQSLIPPDPTDASSLVWIS